MTLLRRTSSRRTLLIGIGAITLCAGSGVRAAPTGRDLLVYIGMHGDRIHAARFDQISGTFAMIGPVAQQSAPTWAVLHPDGDILYYVREDGNDGSQSGGVEAWRIDHTSGALTAMGGAIAQGGGTTHMHLDAPSMTIVVANFGGATLSTIPILAEGRLGQVSSVLNEFGSGPLKRQSYAHPHGVTIDPSGGYALMPDLGADRIFVHRFDRQARALRYDRPDQALGYAMKPGSGPRHVAFHPNGWLMFALTELSGEVMSFRWDAKTGGLSLIDARTTSTPGFTGERSVSELAISADGQFLYLTDRGENSILVHRIDPANGALTFVQRLPCGGEFPWHFAIDPSGRWMLVANERSNRIEIFAIDKASGRLTPTGRGLTTPKPVHILFAGEIR